MRRPERRREKIQQESAFFGSMDGATKYVKGDATAGLIITRIELCRWYCHWRPHEWCRYLSTALQTYSILTIGDGLASQIPSLMISLATGILVTKRFQRGRYWKYTTEDSLFSTPKVMNIVGIALIGLGYFYTS